MLCFVLINRAHLNLLFVWISDTLEPNVRWLRGGILSERKTFFIYIYFFSLWLITCSSSFKSRRRLSPMSRSHLGARSKPNACSFQQRQFIRRNDSQHRCTYDQPPPPYCVAKQVIDKAERCIHSSNRHEVLFTVRSSKHLTHHVANYRLLLADYNSNA